MFRVFLVLLRIFTDINTRVLVGLLAVAAVLAVPATATEVAKQKSVADVEMEVISVIGERLTQVPLPGSAQVLDAQLLERFALTDIHQILAQVPGVSIREEDGYGLRPNIGLRGSGSDRSGRITLMEDGILIAPAPYAAPSAYYFPTTGRIHSIEVFKGPASIRNGPYTVGGVVNMLSTPIAEREGGRVLAELGSDSERRVHAHYSASGRHLDGLVERHQWSAAGFKKIDNASTDTGLDKVDSVVKLRLHNAVDARIGHALYLRWGEADETSRQSYLGLTDTDLRNSPYRRYAASGLDQFTSESETLSLRYSLDVEGHNLSLTRYRNRFKRNWFKTEGLDMDGSRSAADFNKTSWSSVIDAVNRGASGADIYRDILAGADTPSGAIGLRDNSRRYLSQGVDVRYRYDYKSDRAEHRLRLGWRIHNDEEDRLQRNSTYTQSNARLLLADAGEWGNAGNRLSSARARALHAQYELVVGRWRWSPGVRRENIEQKRRDWVDAGSSQIDSRRRNSVQVTIPGMGVVFSQSETLHWVAGVHTGFSPAGSKPGVKPEKSVNYELGVLRQSGLSTRIKAFLFYNDYSNILGSCTASTGGDCEVGEAFSGRGADIRGLEFQLDTALGRTSTAAQFELSIDYTWTQARFTETFNSDFFGAVSAGDPLPYVSEQRMSAVLGWERAAWMLNIQAVYVSGLPDERINSHWQANVSAHYRWNEAFNVYLRVDRLRNQNAVIARSPYGALAQRPMRWVAGWTWKF